MSTTTGTLNEAAISAVAYLNQREIDPNVVDVANEQQFSDLFRLFNREVKVETGQANYHTWVNDDLFYLQTVGLVSTNIAQTVVFAIGGTGFVRQYDVIHFVNGKIGQVRSISTTSGIDTLTVKAVNGDTLTVTAADLVAVPFNGVEEGSSEIANINYSVVKYYNLIQAFRERDSITDIAAAGKTETMISGSPYFYVYQQLKKAMLMKSKISNAFLVGRFSTNSDFGTAGSALTGSNGRPIQFTRGLNEYVETYGILRDVATPGTVVLSDYGNLNDSFNAAKAPSEHFGVGGDKAMRPIYDCLKNLGSSGVTSVRMMVDGRQVDFNVDQWKYGSHTYNLMPMKSFDHPQLINFVGAGSIRKYVYWIPTGMTGVVGGGSAPYIRSRYIPQQMKKNYGTEVIGEGYNGLLAPDPSGSDAVWDTIWLSYQGLEMLAVQHDAKQKVAA